MYLHLLGISTENWSQCQQYITLQKKIISKTSAGSC